jgi:hypothetical protein
MLFLNLVFTSFTIEKLDPDMCTYPERSEKKRHQHDKWCPLSAVYILILFVYERVINVLK